MKSQKTIRIELPALPSLIQKLSHAEQRRLRNLVHAGIGNSHQGRYHVLKSLRHINAYCGAFALAFSLCALVVSVYVLVVQLRQPVVRGLLFHRQSSSLSIKRMHVDRLSAANSQPVGMRMVAGQQQLDNFSRFSSGAYLPAGDSTRFSLFSRLEALRPWEASQ